MSHLKNGTSGRSSIEAVIGLLAVLVVVPPIASTALYAMASVLGLVIPWLGLAVLVAVTGACVAAIAASLSRARTFDGPPVYPPTLPPVPRPPGIPDRRREH